MPANRVAENVLGTMGAIFWAIQLVPQVWKSYRTKSTDGLSHWLVLLWAISGGFLGVYVIVQNLNIPLIVQPQLLATLSLLSWTQCQYYGNKHSKTWCIVVFFTVAAIIGVLQAGLVFAIRPSHQSASGNKRVVQFFGIMSSALLSFALLPQYYEIWKHREVVGISVAFMAIDLLGGVCSDLSLAFKDHFDIIAAVTYTIVVVMDAAVIIAAIILNPRARRQRLREAQRASFTAEPETSETNGATLLQTNNASSEQTDNDL